jgi:exonuclease SbcC
MRPLHLKLQGFGPYLEPQEIALDDVELFAITGPTGSGKSTLLDAICFALYRKTPRIGRGLQNLRHPHAPRSQVELTFRLQDRIWRVARILGDESQAWLESLEEGRWKRHPMSDRVADLDQALQQLLGMDFEAFTRSALLPQGKFDSFLRGKPNERRELLKQLYGLERLSAMQEWVKNKGQALQEEIAQLRGELQGLEGASEDELAQLNARLEELRKREEALPRLLEAEQTRLQELRAREASARRIQELESLQAAHARRAVAMERLRQEVRAAERVARLWPLLEVWQRSQQEVSERERALARLEEQLSHQRAELARRDEAELGQKLAEVRQKLADRPLLEERLALLVRLGGRWGLEHPDPLPYDPDRWEELAALEAKLKERERLEEALAGAKAEQARLQEEQAQAEAAYVALEGQIAEHQGLIQQLSQARQVLEERVEEARHLAGLWAYRGSLRLGAPCPLCGEIVRKLPEPPAQSLQELEGELGRVKEELRRKERDVREAERQKAVLRGEREQREARLAALAEQLSGLVRQLTLLPEVSRVAVAEERRRRLAGLAQELALRTGGEEPQAYFRRLKAEEERLAREEEELRRLREALRRGEGQHEALREALEQARLRVSEDQQRLEEALQREGFSSPDELRSAYREPSQLAQLQNELQQFDEEGRRLAEELARERERGLGQAPEPQELKEAEERLERLKQEQGEISRELGRREEELRRLQQSRERAEALRKLLAEREQVSAVWRELALDLRNDRFPEFILEAYQHELVKQASEVLHRLSQGRYRLAVREGQYLIEDLTLSVQRLVETLSGGESFLASFALALALSERLSQGRLEALFLDEGFGTLDVESLEQVAEVLESLPLEGRLVGIVTHVEALAERLPARLRVSKQPQGSQVRWDP